jgi:gliding motility-associated-like protein
MTRVTILALCFLSAALKMSAQSYNQYWWFGNGSTLDFTTNPPTYQCTPVYPFITGESSASVSDPITGQLILYAGFDSIYNGNHQAIGKMAYGTNISWVSSVQQNVLILPLPLNDTLFYYFFNPSQFSIGGKQRLFYGVVNIKANGGVGAIVMQDSIVWTGEGSEGMCVTMHCNERDYWIVTKTRHPTGFFSAFLLSPTGLNTTPIISPAYYTSSTDFTGLIKFSPNGKLMISTFRQKHIVELYNFDNSTGNITGRFYCYMKNPVGAEFSPDSKLVYCADNTGWTDKAINQYDCNALDSNSWNASKVPLISPDTNYGPGLQLGPDDKIYISGRKKVNGIELSTIGVINNPNAVGQACSLNMRLHAPTNFYNAYDVPNLCTYKKTKRMSNAAVTVDSVGCKQYTGVATIDTSMQYMSSSWIMGDGSTHTAKSFTHQYSSIPASGYTMMFTIQYTPCLADTFMFKVNPCITDTTNTIDTTSNVDTTSYEDTIFVPNAFTPGNDDLNEKFKVLGTSLASFEMAIYSKWGQQLYFSKDQQDGWDGTYLGKPCDMETYYYLITYTTKKGKVSRLKGDVTLVK